MKILEALPPERLTKEEEFALVEKIQKTPTETLLNELVIHNMAEGFIYSKGVCRGKVADDELFSLVYKTLYRNAKRFRAGGIRFLAFAKAGLRGALSRYWTSINVVKNAAAIVSISDGESYTEAVANWQGAGGRALMSGDSGGLEKEYQSESASEPEFSLIHFRERMGFIQAVMEKKLSPQERMIIDLVYARGFNFQEIGDLLGITRSAIQSMHSESLKKIRQALERQRLLQE